MSLFSFKEKTQRISLKWILFVFYLFLGFLPLVAVSYMTLATNIRSIEDTTKLQMQTSLSQIGLRIESQYIEAKDDLESFAKIFSVSLSKELTDNNFSFLSRQILTKFLADHEQFEMICLYNWDSRIIAMADRELVNHQQFPDRPEMQ